VLALVEFALTGITVFGAIYVQDLLGFSAIEAGLSLLPLTLPSCCWHRARARSMTASGPARWSRSEPACWGSP
jgi:hypothetical protein